MISPFYFVSLPKIRTNNLNTMLMKRNYSLLLLLWCFLLAHQTVYADGIKRVVFSETFDKNNGTGGNPKDGQEAAYTGSIASSAIQFDSEWDILTQSSIYGGYKCMRFGTGSATGSCTTTALDLVDAGKTATLTFRAAGWGGSGTNKLNITAIGAELSEGTEITLTNGTWKDYSFTISNATGEFTITFSGKRGFLDDVKIEETVSTLSAPTMTEGGTFWPNTTEAASKSITIRPASGTSVHYTLDGTEPSATNGTLITMSTNLHFTETKTVKAIAFYETLTSTIVSNTFTLGTTTNSLNDFRQLTDETETRLYLDPASNVRVTAVDGKTFTVKDDTGTMLFDFGETAFNPLPAVNQHIAGWIIGKKKTVDSNAAFVATSNTSPNYMAFAARVTESDVTSVKAITTQQEGAKTYYNLSGLQVKHPTKGVYIANGKKLIVH